MKLLYCIFLLIVAICPFKSAFGHQGHDHDEQDDNDLADTITETDPVWSRNDVHSTKLKGVVLKWKKDPNNPKYVVMKMAARTSGYVSVGFCATWSNGMANCDIVLGWVDSSGGHLHVRFIFYSIKTNSLS
jgi:hypothetical protein